MVLRPARSIASSQLARVIQQDRLSLREEKSREEEKRQSKRAGKSIAKEIAAR